LAVIPPDRRRHGLVVELSLWENLLLSTDLLREAAPRGLIAPLMEQERAHLRLREFAVRPDDPRASAATLSGGNQQRLVLARELSRRRIRAVVAANPTRGLDIGATRAIHTRLRAIAAAGAAVLVLSTDLDEVEALATRVAVLYQGRLVTPSRERPGRIEIGRLMAGLGES
jgi:simple sugar transport system ATP-binding protein